MPNHVTNNLEIICEDDKTMDKIRTMIFDKDENSNKIFTMNKLLPRPPEFSDQKGYSEYGYNWSKAIWGTKWDVYNYDITESGNTISICYQTAWSPNDHWVESLCHYIQNTLKFLYKERPYISVKLTYTELMLDFGGVFEWVPFKNPFSKCYSLLEFARLYDNQLYKDLKELSTQCIPKKNYTGQIPMDRSTDEYLDEALKELPF